MIKQHPLTLITPVKKGRLEDLNLLLEKIRKEIHACTEKEFSKVTTVHYARWFILNRDSFRDEPAIPVEDRLIFSSNYDGDKDEHLTELSTVLATYLDQLYDCCEGYPEPGNRTPETRKKYLEQWQQKTSAFFNGAQGRSLNQIRQEKKLRDHIWNFVSKNNSNGKSAVQLHHEIQKEIDSIPEFEWSKRKAKEPSINWSIFLPYGLLLVVALPLVIIGLIYHYLFFELRDKFKPTKLSEIPDKLVNRLVEDEDLFPQNQFTQVVVMKPGFIKKLNFKIWMLRTRVLAGSVFVKGKLLNIPTIHFARWVMFDKNKHVLFFSNFDGNWQQYLGDFIDQSGWGLSGIFSNTVNFPKTYLMGLPGIIPGMPYRIPGTKLVIAGGAYDEAHFLAWSRSTQVPTQVWYCPYPDLSIKNINNNTKIRNELRKNLNEKKAQLFLKRL